MGWLWKVLSFFVCREPEQIAISGVMLTQTEISRLETRLLKRPGNLRLRYQVLGYMTQHRFMHPELAQRRLDHVLWFIENQADMNFTGSPFCNVMAQEPGYDRVLAAWERMLASADAKPAVIMNAARFFSLADRKQSRELLERGERLQPTSADWAEQLGTDLFREVAVTRMGEDLGNPPQGPPKDLKTISAQALAHFERALSLAEKGERRFHLLADCAKAALEAGRREEAVRYAEETLAIAPHCGGDRHQPDVIHWAHVVHGRAMVEGGNHDAACRDLEAAGRQGSRRAPVLRSFGPDFRLAGLLLDAGRKDAVLSYLARCETFWNPKRVARWRSAILKGERPLMFTGFDPTEPRDEQGPYWVANLNQGG
jgi:hypothetical protein